ncbi:MAG: hypothetical protein CMP07_06100 [Xanthomonadales bacterium]|nr:hypothetical protein [Xanthomonadales bacterium]
MALLAWFLVFGNAGAGESNPSTDWSVAGGELIVELNQGVLAPLGIEAIAVKSLADIRPEHPLGYRRLRFEGLSIQQIRFSAPGGAVDEFFDGYLHYHGGLRLTVGDESLDLVDFRVAPHPAQAGVFQLLDRDGTSWATLDHGHYELVDDGAALELRHANLSMTSRMAELTGRPTLAGQVIGVVHLRAPVVSAGSLQPVRGSQCSSPNWPTEPGFEADVALTAMNAAGGFDPVHFLRCQDCNGADGGPVVIAPNAKLRNVGTADVPWWEQFTPPQPPYGNDQHPFLVWNLYRLDGDGRFEQIGVSGVKHAFFTVNTGCPCAGGNILWTECEDTYSAGNNDLGAFLAPRNEIVPAAALWGRCNSLFDPNCDAVEDGSTTDPFDNRLRLMEQDLDPSANPAARYFVEAWYVVRDDIDIFNTMGWREVTPTWNGATWEFPVAGDFSEGSALDAWVDPAALATGQESVVLETADGSVRVSVAVTDLQDGTWRYDYAVMNHDFMRAGTAGVEPNLELLTNVGFNAIELPLAVNATLTDTGFARADRTRGQDWAASVGPGAIRWENPGDTPLDWGTAFRFSLVVDRPPGTVPFRLYSVPAVAPLSVTILGPESPELLFGDGFESPASQ